MIYAKGLAALLGVFLVISSASIAQAQSANANPRAFGKGYPLQATHLPASELRDRLLALNPHARAKAMHRLKDLVFTSYDLPYIKVDGEGGIFFADDFGPEPADEYEPYMLPPVGEALTEGQTFLLHSRPGAPNVIYLDFNGHTFANTAWGAGPFYGRAYDTSGNDTPPWGTNADCTTTPPTVTVSFTATELARIHEIWHRVAEDYAPFDVDVTTEEPAAFDRYTGRILFTDNYDYCGDQMPSYTAGGVAYVGVFGDSNYHTYTSPALVYNSGVVGASEAATHEMGHNLSLGHDGNSSTGASYYAGHGSNFTSWGPIMGAVYSKHITQWSKGDYSLFLQVWSGTYYQQDLDDLKWIDCRFALVSGGPNCDTGGVSPIDGLGYAADDHGDSIATASALEVLGDGTITVTNPETDPGNSAAVNKGIIGDRNDIDYFYFDAGAGDLSIVITPAWEPFWSSGYRGANLDIDATLYDSTGTLVTSDAPTDETDAVLVATEQPAGRYYLAIDGEGCVAGCAHEGYDDYASIGQYFISGLVPPASDDQDPPGPAPTFASGPTAVDAFSITMTSTVAADDTGPVEYQFNCTNGGAGCVTSAWQTGTTFLATGLDPNTSYVWQVRARDQVLNLTGYSAISSATTPDVAPAAPSGLGAAAVSQTAIDISWADNSNNETNFIVLHSPDGVSYSLEATLSSNSTSYSDTGLATATTHWYKVYATNAIGDSAEAGPVNTTTWDSPPAAPTTLTAIANGAFQVDLAWTDNSNNETGFEVWRSINGTDFSLRTTGAANSTSWSDSGLTPSTQYWYKVLATNTGGDSAFSNTDSVTTDPAPPNAPSALTAAAVSNAQIDLDWTDNSNDESGFEIWRSTDGTNFSLRTTEAANTTSWSDTGLASSTQYWYKALAANTGGDSAYSNTATDTTFEGCSMSMTYTGGEWYQVALPCNPLPNNTVADVFGAGTLVYFNQADTEIYTRIPDDGALSPHTGYWIRFAAETTVNYDGYPNTADMVPVVSDAATGVWNLVGYSRNDGAGMEVSWPNVEVRQTAPPNKSFTVLEADPEDRKTGIRECDNASPSSDCIMYRVMYTWDGAGAYQVRAADNPDPLLRGTFVSGQAIWVKFYQPGYQIWFPSATAAAASVPDEASKGKGGGNTKDKGDKGGGNDGNTDPTDWYVRLVAESGKLRDPGNSFGQSGSSVDGVDGHDLEEPSPIGTYLSILFTNPLFDEVPWGYTTDFRALTDTPAGEWPFKVMASSLSEPITLKWQNLGSDVVARLVDEQTGEVITAEPGGSYTFTPSTDSSRFTFIIE